MGFCVMSMDDHQLPYLCRFLLCDGSSEKEDCGRFAYQAINYRLLLPFAGITLFKFQEYFLRRLKAVFNCAYKHKCARDYVLMSLMPPLAIPFQF